MDGIKEFKEKRDEYGTLVKYWDEYSFLGNTYVMEEIDVAQEMAIGELLTELDIQNLQSVNDILKVKLGMFLSAALKHKVAPRFLSIVLKRKDRDGVLQPCEAAEFQRGLARIFNPLFKEVVMDFFTMNSELLNPITEAVKRLLARFGELTNQFTAIMGSITSATETLQSSPQSPKSKGGKR